MSRIGKKPIAIPKGVEIKINDNVVSAQGPKGELTETVHPDMIVRVEDDQLIVERPSDSKEHRSFHGLYRSLLNNLVTGVSQGYRKELELVGVGYKAEAKGQVLELNLGYSHLIAILIPKELKVETETKRGTNPKVTLEGIDKQLIGHIASKIRSLRPPEPYKGKGVRFVGEEIRRKAGKTGAK